MATVGSLLTVAGSLLPWAVLDQFNSLGDESGVDLGYGWFTLVLGLGTAVAAVRSLRSTGSSRLGTFISLGALAALVVLAVALVDLQARHSTSAASPDFSAFDVGILVSASGCAVTAVSGWRLKTAS